jgi:hypothetical protein
MKKYLLVLVLITSHFASSYVNAQGWELYEEGIQHFVIQNKIHVFKINQSVYSFKAKGSKDTYKTMPEWIEDETGGINLNMFISGWTCYI